MSLKQDISLVAKVISVSVLWETTLGSAKQHQVELASRKHLTRNERKSRN